MKVTEQKRETWDERAERIQREIHAEFRLGRVVAALATIALREAESMRNSDFNDGFLKGYRAAREDHEAGRLWRVLETEKEESGER